MARNHGSSSRSLSRIANTSGLCSSTSASARVNRLPMTSPRPGVSSASTSMKPGPFSRSRHSTPKARRSVGFVPSPHAPRLINISTPRSRCPSVQVRKYAARSRGTRRVGTHRRARRRCCSRSCDRAYTRAVYVTALRVRRASAGVGRAAWSAPSSLSSRLLASADDRWKRSRASRDPCRASLPSSPARTRRRCRRCPA